MCRAGIGCRRDLGRGAERRAPSLSGKTDRCAWVRRHPPIGRPRNPRLSQSAEQHSRRLQVHGVEPLREPIIDRLETREGVSGPALIS
jgi:hypothetical protein